MNTNEQWSGKWTKVKPLGGGGQGDTLLVCSSSDETKQAVLKLLKPHKAKDPKARRRMYQEVANLKILRSAGGKVPEILDGNTEVFENLEVPMFFVMEFIPGRMLADVVTESGNLTVECALGIALDLCTTLRTAVKEGIVHRDIKPENIITRSTTPPDVVMVDFGLSFNEDADPTNTSVDEGLDNKFISLPERRGPGENKRDPRSDITDVCAILYYCLTGCSPRNLRDSQNRPPHRRPNYELSGRVTNQPQLNLLNALLDRGLSLELDSRFQTVEDLVGRLNEIANPGAKRPVEDLETVVARESSALRKSDRKTQLTEYFQNAVALRQSIDQCIHSISQTLAKHRTFTIHNIQQLDRVHSKVANGDCFAQWQIRLQIRDHPVSFDLRFSIIAHGSECEIVCDTLRNAPKQQQQVVETQTLDRYQGDAQPDKAKVVAEIRNIVTNAIPALAEFVRNGY